MNKTSYSLRAGLQLVAACVVLGCLSTPARAGNPNLLFTRLPDFSDGQVASPYTVLADMNGDGRPDLVRSAGGVDVQLGLGSGSFAAGNRFSAGNLVGPLAVGDFNNDGKLDVVVANVGSADNGSLSLLLGNGNGTLQNQTVINLGFVVRRIIVTDYNKDGKADIIAIGYHSGAFPLEGYSVTLPGNGNGTFGAPTFYVNSGRTDYADTRDVVVGDFNGDTWPDFIVSNPLGHAIAVFYNNQNGTFTRRAREMSLLGNLSALATGDFNGDGRLDLAFTLNSDQTYGNTGADNNVAVVDGNGDGTFGTLRTDVGPLDEVSGMRTYRARPAGNTYVQPYSRLLAQDMDGDGVLDLVFVADAGDGLYDVLSILRGAGNGTFSYGAQLAPSYSSSWISVADLNQDGAVDLIVTPNSATAQTFMGIPPGSGTLLVTTALDEDNGSVNPSQGTGTSLREAWNQAIGQVTPQTITFAANLAGRTIFLTNVSDTSRGSSALRVPPGRNITVQGVAGDLGITIDGGGVARPFLVAYDFGGSGTSGTLTLSDLTIQNGRGTYGGGIYNLGTLTMQRCTLTRNNATSLGGALYTGGSGLSPAPRALLVNCTVANNTGAVPGILADLGRLDMLHVTISSNNAGCCSALSISGGATVTMTNTIVAGNSPADISSGNVHPDSRYNLIGTGGSGGLVDGVNGNRVGVANPRLGPLTNNGGPTLTMTLQIYSQARDNGLGGTAAAMDQRGVSRPQGAAPDIGAFELQTIAPQITSANAATFTIGTSSSFTFTASGSPVPFFDTTSPLPAGVSLSPSGLLSGTPSPNARGVYSLTIIADNGVAPAATQTFTLSVVEAPGLVVNTTNDVASIYDGVTSLREAVAYANSLSGTSTITFASALAGKTVLLNTGWSDTNDLAALRVSGALAIQGLATAPGVTISVASGIQKQHLVVEGSGNLTVANLTFSNGSSDYGGSIRSFGKLVVRACTFTGNQASSDGGAVHAGYNSLLLLVENSTFTGNSSPLSAAIATGAQETTLRHLTVTANTGGGAILLYAYPATMVNSIAAGNSTDGIIAQFGAAFTSGSANNILGTGGSGGLTNGVNGNLVGVAAANLFLGSLANNGGPTRTVALLPGSPAANAGASIVGVSADQRGFQRPEGSGLMGRFYAMSSTSTTLLSPLSNLEALTPLASSVSPRIDFGAGTETTPGDGTVLDRAGTTGNPFGGLGVNLGLDNIAALWTGFINVPETADYRFTTRSDDGSVLHVDGPLLVNNNFLQGMNNRAGTVHLSAGRHALRIGFFEAGGEAGMQLSWEKLTGSAPFARQIVPPSALSIGTTPDIGAFQHFVAELPAALISPASGIYDSSVTVTLSTPTVGATIRYTTDGSAPTETHGDVYTAPFTLSASTTVRAVAVLGGWLPSSPAGANYDVRAALANWRALHGLATDGSQDFQNPSGAGVANIAKYAFNLASTAGSLAVSNRTVLPPGGTAGIPAITVNASRQLNFQFVRRKASTNPGVGYLVETSTDLANWSEIVLSNAIVESIDATWERVTVLDPVSTPMRFGRVKLVRLDAYRNDFNAALGAASLRGTAVWTNQSVQLTDTIGGQYGTVVFDGPYAGPALNGFTARFNMNVGPAGQPVPADGISFVVGDLGASAWGESGPGTARNITVSFDTYDNGGDGSIGIRVFTNGVAAVSNPLNPFTQGVTVPVEISYDAAAGITVRFNGATIFNQVALPGFVLPSGSKFGMGGRTGGSVERAVVDDVQIFPR